MAIEQKQEDNDDSSSGIRVQGMQFSYNDIQQQQPPLFVDFNLHVSPGSRCLLVGANGSGKTTLLKILAGKHMVGGKDVVRVLNCSAFHDTQLVCSGDLAYLGGSWSKNVGCAVSILFFFILIFNVVRK
jgi:CCR4-NOT complex subunit CAF16